ncbi:PRKDC kinase, partial [Polypterus senegalus]
MALSAARGVHGCLQKLHALLDIGDSNRANEEARDLIRDLGHECMLARSESELVLQTSLLFSKEDGLLLYLRKSLSIDDLRESRDEVLKLLIMFLERVKNRVIGWEKTYGLDIKLLYDCRGSTVLQDFKIADIFNKFYGDLVQKSKFADTVLEKVYELLGVLAEVQPSDMLDNSDKLYRAYLSELKLQMTSATREPKLPLVAGCLKGLTALMINFTKSMDEDPKTSKEIFDYALKAITPQTELKRYAVLLAGLYLFSKHASQFSTCLLDNYQYLFEILSKYCSHSNVDMKKAGHAALDTFLKQVSLLVAENAELHKSKLEYFMRQFYSIIRTLDCSTKELSIAIRGYGLFAGPCKALKSNDSDDIDFMYTELIQRCKQMYLTESDTEDDNMYQLPSFLDSISSVILHLDKIPEVYTPVLERLLVVQIDSFPQYSQKMQPACCRSIIKVLVALAGKGPVLWSFISTVVNSPFLCGFLPYLYLVNNIISQIIRLEEESDQEKDAQVRSGKWKIPSYRDYLDLFKSLLDCDKMMESGFIDTEALGSPLRSLNRLLYDELMKSLLKIIEKLDLSVHTPHVEEEVVGNFPTENNLSIPSSDPSANLFPSKPKDFTAFINLVDFCSELLLQKHNDYFAQWVYVLGYELILQSTRFPLGVGPKTIKPVPDNQNVYACFALFAKFGKEVCSRMKQYKDELLASCLFFVLSLPPNIVTLDIRPYIPSLQTAFILGLSHPPLANAGLEALENWSEFIPKHDIQPFYNNVLPCLDGYLKATALIATCAEDMMKKCVAWETEKKLNFPMPFADMKPIIFLDVFLPHVAELALSTSDRQTKVAACELLHSILMYMLGKGSQMPEGPSIVPPLYRLHKHIFPVLLRLACDVDQVTRQLYEPLVMQLIHWFTSNKKFESQDTVAMLEAILDGLVHPVESTLRDFCGQCVQEFLKWSIKQTTPEQQKNSPANTKSLFKRLYSLALHPNAFKRLGAALAFNSIYKHFREEEALVDQFVFEVLVIYIESLALAHTDDKSLGNKNTSLWLDDLIKKQGVSFLIDCFECGGSVKSGSGILSKRTLQEIQEPFSLRITLWWMDMLLASLDCYNTFIGLRFVKPYEILGSDSKSGFLQAVRFFLNKLALHDVSAAEKCFESGAKGVLFSPREQEHYNFKKGTIIVRTLEFVTMVLENCQPQFWKVLENHVLNPDFFKLTAVAVCIPSNIGFNMADVEVMKNLPDTEPLVDLLLNTVTLSVPLSGHANKNFISFSHGEYFYNLFQDTINYELLRNQDISVTILMKSASENPKMVSMVLNGMLDQSFRDRSVRKTEGLRLVQEVLTNWDNFKPWWASSTASENKMSVLILLSKVLQSQALIILPFFTNLPESILLDLQTALEKLVACHFPMQSDEFPTGTLRYNNYVDSIKKLLDALEMSQSPMLLKLMTEILCRDNRHIMEELFQTCFRNIAKRGACSKQVSLLDTVFQMFQTEDPCASTTRQAVVDRCLLTILFNCSLEALTEFLCKTVAYIMTILQARFLKSNESAFDTQLAKKNGCYKIMEVVYSRLPKEEVYSKESKVNQAYCGHNKSEGNELSKTLLKCCFDAFTENMAGETQLLEERRRHHCYAYNCAVAVISCSFNEVKFYQGFLFSEKPEKVPLEKKKKYLAIRKEAREADEPHYLSSQSYMADSSLSEEMSQFDFSTGIQSFSIGSQASTSAVVRSKRKVERAESTAQGDSVELEMDELNAHECMATLTALISHMQKNNITPKVEEGTAPVDLPVWMKFLNVKLGNPSTPLNIRLFIAKLIINSEEVFRPYARHWLGPLLQLVVSDKNGGEGIHYMVVEIVVVLLSWTSVTSPKGNIKDEVLANRLLEFLMKNAFHKKRAVYRHNLEIIKTVVECWKDSLEIPYRLIYECFSGKDPNSKNNSVGLQLLGIVLANNLPPFHPMCGIESESTVSHFQNIVTLALFPTDNNNMLPDSGSPVQALQVLQLEGPIFHFTVKELKQLQDKQEGTFVVCLNKITKNFPKLADRDEARQQVCLDIIHKILAKLKPDELKELLEPITAFIQHPSPVCREKMYDILMWIYDNYRDEESQRDPISSEVFCLSKESLLQGLMDENQPLQLYVRNFWSHETRLPINTLERMLIIFRSMYSSKIESEYLSLATNLLLEMTSRSPDYTRDIFEYPLSECKFQDYTIHSNWRNRSTILTPMFVETQATQGGIRDRSQDGSMSSEGTIGGQVRATQAQLEFTPTQTAGRRSSYNWMTGASIDTFMDYSLPTSSESLSSSLLVFGKRGEKIQKAERKPVGVDFGSKRLGLPGDEVDSGTKVKDQRADILRLRRRFLKDQEKVSHIYAQKNIREQKQEKANVAEQKLKKEGQITLYRRYRQGDLPDIQIQYSSLIAPLQALAQRDPTFAKQLFSSLFTGILVEMKNSKGSKEKKSILEELLEDINTFLSKSTMYFPPFVSCVQVVQVKNQCCDCLIQWTQYDRLNILHGPDKIGRSLGDYDVLRGIFSGKIGAKSVTSKALQAEAKSDYAEAAKLYNEALNMENWPDGEPTEAEKDLWELAALEAYNQLTEWKSLQYCSTVNIDDKTPSDLEKIWLDPFYQETYLPYVMRSMVKLLQLGEPDQSLLTFVDNAMKADDRKSIIETHYSQELSLLYILQDDFHRAKYYINNCMQIFMQNYSSIDGLLHGSRLAKLQSVQTVTEIQDFLNFMTKDVSRASVKHLIRVWTGRYPDDRMDPMNIWDDIITNRCFFLDKISEKLGNLEADNSMEVDEEGSADVQMELDEPVEGLESVIKSCKFNMKLKMADSARKQKNFSVATKLLKELHREAKTQKDWLIRWVHSFSRFNHCRCQNQRSSDQILFVLKTIPLLEENQNDPIKTSYRISRDHNMLLGTSYSIIADVIAKDLSCLAELGEEKLQRLGHLSGASPGDTEQVTVGLHRRALQLLQGAVKKVDEELQSLSEEYVDTRGAIEAYMTLANFCDRRLREEEESAQIPRLSEIISFPTVVVEKMLKALKLNSEEARLKFPRLLQLIELYPAETLDLMAKEVSSVPCWQLIGWLSQMMALLDKKEAVAVYQVITEIAESYPQALIYPFMISSENYDFEDSAVGHRNKEFVARLKSKLDKGGVYEDFINALQQLTNPDMLFKDWLEEVKNELEKPKKDKQILRKLYEDMWSTLGDPRAEGIGAFRRKFAEKFGKEFNSTFGKSGSKIPEMRHEDFYKTASKLQQLMKEFGKEPGNLKEYSPWMSDFRPEVLGNDLEIPGQYDGKSKPLPEYHAKIAGFDERVKVMSSIRRPKRLIIQGNDEREYPFLVKGGEDLRQDQRIEQLFGVMNIILSRDAACSQRNLQLKTYHVIPMTTRIGLIEWLENTCTLKEFLLNKMSEDEAKKPLEIYDAWLSKVASKEQGARRYEVMYKRANRTETITSFQRLEHLVSGDLLRKAFMQMSMTPEAFLSLRSHFASSHALMCISHWILGIGDRHLSNFMINMETGGMVGIDFGHAFGSATQFLPVPELMPFRLTRQLLNLMLPMGVSGLLYSIMVHSLRAYRADPDLLLNTMDVFVKEPSLDWKNFELKQLKKAGTWTLTVDTKNINWYPLQKVNFARRKLEGANPAAITGDELKLGFEKNPAFQSILAVAQGTQEFNMRAREAAHGLSVETQVECLIDQATDPNLLGRVWQGWEPWV